MSDIHEIERWQKELSIFDLNPVPFLRVLSQLNAAEEEKDVIERIIEDDIERIIVISEDARHQASDTKKLLQQALQKINHSSRQEEDALKRRITECKQNLAKLEKEGDGSSPFGCLRWLGIICLIPLVILTSGMFIHTQQACNAVGGFNNCSSACLCGSCAIVSIGALLALLVDTIPTLLTNKQRDRSISAYRAQLNDLNGELQQLKDEEIHKKKQAAQDAELIYGKFIKSMEEVRGDTPFHI